MTQIGDNSLDKTKLKSFVDRMVEREEEKRAVAQDIRDIKAEAKAAGVDPAALSAIVKEKLRDAEKAAKAEKLAETVDQYKHALGMLSDMPLGQAALARAGK